MTVMWRDVGSRIWDCTWLSTRSGRTGGTFQTWRSHHQTRRPAFIRQRRRHPRGRHRRRQRRKQHGGLEQGSKWVAQSSRSTIGPIVIGHFQIQLQIVYPHWFQSQTQGLILWQLVPLITIRDTFISVKSVLKLLSRYPCIGVKLLRQVCRKLDRKEETKRPLWRGVEPRSHAG
jgi:hypothetical protein